MRLIIFSSVFLFLLTSCDNRTYTVSKSVTKQTSIDSTLEGDNSINQFLTPYRAKIDTEMSKVLAFSPRPLFKNEAPLNTGIGNMMADAVMQLSNPIFKQRYNAEIDIVLLNYGGIRGGINQGNVTTRTAFNIMPFENEVVVVKLDSVQLKALINYLVEAKSAHPIAGLKLKLQANGQLDQAEVNSQPLDKPYYYVATSDYLAKGGDQMDFFTQSDSIFRLDYKLRKLFIDYFEQQDTLNSHVDQRFTQQN